MPYLVIQKGPNEGQALLLDQAKSSLGRAWTCTIVLESPKDGSQKNAISREHVVITREGERYYIADGDGKGKKSRNGTRINDKDLPAYPARMPLENDDTIKICDYVLVFHGGPVPAEDSPSSIDASADPDSGSTLTHTADKLRSLLQFSNRLNQTLELDLLWPQVVENLLVVFKKAERAFLVLVDEASGDFILQSYAARGPRSAMQSVYSKSIVRVCVEKVQGFISNNLSKDVNKSESIEGLALQSVMCAPLRSQEGKVFGVLVLDIQKGNKRFKQEDLTFLMGVANQASIALANARFHLGALMREVQNRDLALAREVVKSFLPASVPEIPGYEFFAFNESAREVGGDLHDFIELPGGRLAILVGDVAGKGVAAALVMARFSAEARACLRTEPDLAAAVRRLNDLMQPLNLTDRFVTLVVLLLDPTAHTLTVVNAGHPPPLLLRRDGAIEEVVSRNTSGPPLGVVDGYGFEAIQLNVDPGDNLILFSDGINEAQDVNRRQLGTRRIRSVLQAGAARPRVLGERILSAVRDHAAGRPQYDDITLVCFGRQA
jgi:sigma-B regulation protein RsbU (phosphoserine phosphatase)